jgi:hypothetical protein
MRWRPATLAALVLVCVAAPASAQTGRASGTVRDVEGRGIMGATVRASNPDASPPEIVSTSDDRGRWAMIGLRSGTWRFVAEAPGFGPVAVSSVVRSAAASPMEFTLARDPGPIPGALASNIQAQVAAAGMLRDQGRLDEALEAYRLIRARNPTLTAVNLVIGQLYRQQAAQEPDAALRRDLFDRAIAAYVELLETDADHEPARRELDATRREAENASR